MRQPRPTGVIIAAIVAITFGFGEIVVGVTGNYLGILVKPMAPSFAAAVTGAFYCLGGLSLLITRMTWGVILSLIFIGAEILGRIYLVTTGSAPSTGVDFLKIIIGGVIALALMVYIAWRSFR